MRLTVKRNALGQFVALLSWRNVYVVECSTSKREAVRLAFKALAVC